MIDGYIQYFYDQNILGFKKFTSTRLTSVFYNEPILGSYLLKIVPLMLSIIFYFFSNNFKIVILSYIFLGFVEVLIFMSGDRTPLLSITIFAFIIILCSNNFRFLRLITFFFYSYVGLV